MRYKSIPEKYKFLLQFEFDLDIHKLTFFNFWSYIYNHNPKTVRIDIPQILNYMILKALQSFILIFLFFALTGSALVGQPIIAPELFSPKAYENVTAITHCGDERVFVAEQAGIIWTLDSRGRVFEKPFLDISDRVGQEEEQGIQGLTFHPDFPENGRFFVYYTNMEGSSILASFFVKEEDTMYADSLSEQILLIFNQPFEDRNGGDIAFGPDGFLYMSTGDGGGEGDPYSFGQSKETFLGKILRLDINEASGYGIPKDNPYASKNLNLDEIWAVGLRDPSGLHFDTDNGDLWLVDRGEEYMDEVNVIWAEDEFGQNLGWSCYEGTRPIGGLFCSLVPSFSFPIAEHRHQSQSKSLIGGAVYRGDQYPALWGKYIYADQVSSSFYMLEPSENGYIFTEIGNLEIESPSCIGTTSDGEILVASGLDGMIYRITDFCQAYQPYLFFLREDIIQFQLESGNWNDDFIVEWYQEDWMIDQTKDSILVVPVSDNYSVTVIHERGCVMYSNEIQVQLLGPAINWQELIQVWPNPFTTSFTLESLAEWEMDAMIVDSDGRIVDAQVIPPNTRFSWHVNLPKGLYTIQMIAPGGNQHSVQVIRK